MVRISSTPLCALLRPGYIHAAPRPSSIPCGQVPMFHDVALESESLRIILVNKRPSRHTAHCPHKNTHSAV
ncbi:hypothetical protein FA95DRAFT_1554939 [Auriscalpium vulgare]|uniref:Uncharacterized protein n=1 Tax=Auriscalpium vulgare TaxID=40419 RepID=A0ACB8S3Q7_9AGAM|nr:hypothetical protein FA95DRAFT_1554939 [Auriscalpium vulgare]